MSEKSTSGTPIRLQPSQAVFPPTYISSTSKNVLTIVSSDSKKVQHYEWRRYATEEKENNALVRIESLGPSARQLLSNFRLFSSNQLKISPIKDEIWPLGSQMIVAEFKPRTPRLEKVTAYLYNVETKKRIPYTFECQGVPATAEFNIDQINIGHISLDKRYEYKIILKNTGQIPLDFVLLEKTVQSHLAIELSPEKGHLEVNESTPIYIKLDAQYVGQFNETFEYKIISSIPKESDEENVYKEIDDDYCEEEDINNLIFDDAMSRQGPSISIYGRVIGPAYDISKKKIDFGTVSYGFLYKQTFEIQNKSEIPLDYNFSLVPDKSYESREFKIDPDNGTIPKNSTQIFEVNFIPISIQDYNVRLIMDSEKFPERLASILITATCVCPDIAIKEPVFDLGPIFYKHTIQTHITFMNTTNYASKFEFVDDSDDQSRLEATVALGKFTGIISPNGESEVPVFVTPLQLGYLTISRYVRIFGSDEQPLMFTFKCLCTGPNIKISLPEQEMNEANSIKDNASVSSKKTHKTEKSKDGIISIINFGSIPVLEQNETILEVFNDSLISAPFHVELENSSKSPNAFSIGISDGEFKPGEKINFPIKAFLNDCLTFNGKLIFSFKLLNPIIIPVKAKGKGSSIVSSIDMKTIDMGFLFSGCPVYKYFELKNHGKRIQEVKWQNNQVAKPKIEHTIPNDPPRFRYSIEPIDTMIHPDQVIQYTIKFDSVSSCQFEINPVCETVVDKNKSELFKPLIKGHFIKPALQFEEDQVFFEYIHDTEREEELTNDMNARTVISPSVELLQPMIFYNKVSNVSELPLDVSASITPPFYLSQEDFIIQPGETIPFQITFKTDFKKDFTSQTIDRKITFALNNNPKEFFINVKGTMIFPNLALSPNSLDFGSILRNTEYSKVVNLSNSGSVPVEYFWELLPSKDDIPKRIRYVEEEEEENNETKDKKSFGKIFDAYPIRGRLEVGESAETHINFCAMVNEKGQSNYEGLAICHVIGGPDYTINLKGSSCLIDYSLGPKIIDFGVRYFAEPLSSSFSLSNSSDIILDYQVKIPKRCNFSEITIEPLTGHLEPGKTQIFNVHLIPGFPVGVINEPFFIQVGEVEESQLTIKVNCQFPQIKSNMPRYKETDPPTLFIEKEIEEKELQLQQLEQQQKELLEEKDREQKEKEKEEEEEMKEKVEQEKTEENKEGEQKETDKKEADKKETEKQEADKKETDKKETDKKEEDKKETDKKETEKKEEDKKEDDKKDGEKKEEGENKDTDKKEGDQIEGENKEGENLENPTEQPPEEKEPEKKISVVRMQAEKNLDELLTKAEETIFSNRLKNLSRSANQYRTFLRKMAILPNSNSAASTNLITNSYSGFVLSRYAVDFGKITIGESKSVEYEIRSITDYPISFTIQTQSLEGTGFEIEQTTFTDITKDSTIKIKFNFDSSRRTFSQTATGEEEHEVPVIFSSDLASSLILKVTIVNPTITLSKSLFDFGITFLGQSRTMTLQVSNTIRIPVEFTIGEPILTTNEEQQNNAAPPNKKKKAKKNERPDVNVVVATPKTGQLPPASFQNIELMFSPQNEKEYNIIVPIYVKHSKDVVTFNVVGVGYQMKVIFNQNIVDFGQVKPFDVDEDAIAAAFEASTNGDESIGNFLGYPTAEIEMTNPTDYPLTVFAPQFDLTIMNQIIKYQFDQLTEKEGTKVPPELLVEKRKPESSNRKGSSLSKSLHNGQGQQQEPVIQVPSNLTNVSKFSICVIVNGPPRSGKSTISKYVSQYLGNIPIVSLKEIWKDLLPPEPEPEPEPEPVPEPPKGKGKANAKGKGKPDPKSKGKTNSKLSNKGKSKAEEKPETPPPPPPPEPEKPPEPTNPEANTDPNAPPTEPEKPPEPKIVTDEMLIDAFKEATSKGDFARGFVVDGLDVFKEPPETELLIQSTFKNKKIVDDMSKNPFTVVPPYVPEGQPPPSKQQQQQQQQQQEQTQVNDKTSVERALSLILAGLTGQYVFQVALQANEEAINKHEEVAEQQSQKEKEEKDHQELQRILEMDEETYAKLTEEEQEAIDKKRQEHRAKVLEESGINLEETTNVNSPPGKGGRGASRLKGGKNAKKGQSRLSTSSKARGKSPPPKKAPPPKKGAQKPGTLDESIQNGMILFNITLGRITNQLQDSTNTKFQSINPAILKGSSPEEAVQSVNSILLDSNNEIDFLENQIQEFLPELKDIEEKAQTQLMPQEKVILPSFFQPDEIPHLYEAPRHFNILNLEKAGDFPVLKRYEKPMPPPSDGNEKTGKGAKKINNKIIVDNTLTEDLDIYKYSKRWTLQPNQTEKLKIQFIANEIGAFEDNLLFCVENCRNDVFKFQVQGICMYPDFDRDPHSIFKETRFVQALNPNPKKIESDIFVEDSNEYYFGPLIVAGKDRGKKDPYLYSKKIFLTNNSPFDAEITVTVYRTTSESLIEAHKANMNATNSTTNTQRGSKKKEREVDNSNIWGVENNKITIPTGETGEVQICLHPIMPDTYYCTYEFFIKDNPEPFYLKSCADVSSPILEVSTTHLDFGKILLNHEKKLDIILKNPLKIPSFWRFKNPQAIGNTFNFSQTEGTVNPRGQAKVHVTFSSNKTVAVKKQLQLDVLDKMKQKTYVVHHINVTSEAFDLPFEFLYPKGSDHLEFGTMKVGQAKSIICTLKNKGKYPSSFTITYTKPKYSKFLQVSEMGGDLQPSDKPLNINFIFGSSNKQLKFEHQKFLTVTFYEPEEKTEVGNFDIFVTGSCFFSEYEITPDSSIDFGSTSVGETITKEIQIKNKGMFSFEYEIAPKIIEIAEPSSHGSSLSKAAPRRKNARGASRQGSGSNQGSESNAKRPKNKKELQAGNFFISPLPSGTIQPGNSVTLKVDYFDNESRSSQSTILVRISDLSLSDPAYYNFNRNKNNNKGRTSKNTSSSRQQVRSPSHAVLVNLNVNNNNNDGRDEREGKPIILTGKTFMPGINTKDIEKIFPGQPLCLRYDLQKKDTNAFLEDDQLFHFSPNILNTPQSVDISLKNQFPVPCVVDASVKPIQKKNRRQQNQANLNFPFELSAVSIAIPPLNESSLKLTFTPKTEGDFHGMFEATVRGGTDPNSRLLKFGVEGVGTLPKVKLAEDYGNIVSFGRTLVNTKKEKKLCLQNDGLIPAKIKFSVVQQNNNPDAVTNINKIVPPSTESAKGSRGTSKSGNYSNKTQTPSNTETKQPVPPNEQKGKTKNNKNKDEISSSTSTSTIITEPTTTHNMYPPEFRLEKVDLIHEFEIEPKRSLLFNVSFAPKDLKKSEFTLLISVINNEKSNLKINFAGEGFQEDIVVEGLPNDDNRLIFNDVVVYRPRIKTFYMHNVCEDDARFEWNDTKNVSFSPKVGHLRHGKTKKITATFLSENPLSFEDQEVYCKWSKIRYLDENQNNIPDWDDTMKNVTFIQRGELINQLQMAQMAQIQHSNTQSRNQSRVKHGRNGNSSDSSKLTNLPINGFNFTLNDLNSIMTSLNLGGLNENGGNNNKSRTLLSGRKFPPKKPQPPNRSNLNSRDSSRMGKSGAAAPTPRRKSKNMKNMDSVTNLMTSMSSVSTMTSSGSISLPPLNNNDPNQPDPMTELVRIVGTKQEPPHEFLNKNCKDVTLFVSAVCDFIKYEIVSPEEKEITFSPTMMYDTRVSEVEIKNVSSIRFDYTWVTSKYDALRGGREFTSAHSSPFSVLPTTGFISAGESQTFQVRFTPVEVDDFSSNLWMDVPYLEQQMQNLQQQVLSPHPGTSKELLREQKEILENLQDYPEIFVSGYSQRPLVHFDVDLSDYITAGRRHPNYNYPIPDDIRVVELFSSGIGKTSCKKIIVVNPTSNPYEITWENDQEHNSPAITCDSTRALVSSGKKYTISFSYKPTSLKAVESLWSFSIPEHNVTIPFLIVGKIMPH